MDEMRTLLTLQGALLVFFVVMDIRGYVRSSLFGILASGVVEMSKADFPPVLFGYAANGFASSIWR